MMPIDSASRRFRCADSTRAGGVRPTAMCKERPSTRRPDRGGAFGPRPPPPLVVQSMELRRLHKPCPVGGEYAYGQCLILAHHLQHDLAAGGPARPYLAPQPGETGDRIVTHCKDPVAGAQPGSARRSFLGQPGDDDRILDLGSVEPEPWAR